MVEVGCSVWNVTNVHNQPESCSTPSPNFDTCLNVPRPNRITSPKNLLSTCCQWDATWYVHRLHRGSSIDVDGNNSSNRPFFLGWVWGPLLVDIRFVCVNNWKFSIMDSILYIRFILYDFVSIWRVETMPAETWWKLTKMMSYELQIGIPNSC